MQVTLEREIEDFVAKEVREGRFESPEALVTAALHQFLVAKKYAQEEARKLAVLREELWQARAEADAGRYTEYSLEDLPKLQASVEHRAVQKPKSVKT